MLLQPGEHSFCDLIVLPDVAIFLEETMKDPFIAFLKEDAEQALVASLSSGP